MTIKNIFTISLVETKSGRPSMKLVLDNGCQKAFHSIYDPESEAMTVVDAFSFNGQGILVILGLGLGYHVAELVKRFPEAAIIIVESSPEIYEFAVKHGNISNVKVKSPHTGGVGRCAGEDMVRFIVGLPSDEALKEITKIQVKAGMPPLAVFTLSPAVAAFPNYYNPILASLKNTISVSLWDRIRYPKFKEETAKVALIDFGYFLTVEVEKAIRLLGHKVAKVPVKKGEEGDVIVSRLMRTLLEFKPDFFLTINHLGFDEDGSLTSFLKSIEMPVASWYVDSPDLIVKAFKGNVSPYVSLFLWDRGYIENVKSIGFEDVHYLPLGTDEGVFRPIDPSDKRLNAYRCDVGFVGNSMVEPAGRYISRIKRELHPLIDRIAGAFSDVKRALEGAIDDRLSEQERQIIERFSSKEIMDFEGAILWKATLRYRLSCIRKLKGFKVRIHGDNGWKTLLGNDYYIGCQLNYYKELPLFYNACAINFNATSLQMGQAVNQRVFDVPACGAFVLTDHQKSIEELFDVGTEIATYSDKDEIPELARFYLNNPAEREKRAAKGRERVLREHTYKQRLNKLISIMRARYGHL